MLNIITDIISQILAAIGWKKITDDQTDNQQHLKTDGAGLKNEKIVVDQYDQRRFFMRCSYDQHIDSDQSCISLIRLTISTAPTATSKPLLPALVPARSIACSIFSVVKTPNMTGIPLLSETLAIPLETSAQT